ncbi:MAG TPA: 4Fe-4S dicluster domain-containing protein [Desulfurococcales archaeon]|nr:4Fe-4S dicluster domain-containing protein [Desulfurococcales archaeon]
MGRFKVVIIGDRCKECGICIEICPRKVLRRGDKPNDRGFRPPIPVNEELCTGCKLCEMLCPDFAIYIEESK